MVSKNHHDRPANDLSIHYDAQDPSAAQLAGELADTLTLTPPAASPIALPAASQSWTSGGTAETDVPVAPTSSALVVRRFAGAGLATHGQLIPYEVHQEAVQISGKRWFPVRSECEWRLLKLLFNSGLSKVWINEILDLKMVS